VLWEEGVHVVHMCGTGGDPDRVVVWFWNLQEWVSQVEGCFS
jgi:hypothetical protein